MTTAEPLRIGILGAARVRPPLVPGTGRGRLAFPGGATGSAALPV
ncbi:hypothetical protein [Streptomyces asiaticus]